MMYLKMHSLQSLATSKSLTASLEPFLRIRLPVRGKLCAGRSSRTHSPVMVRLVDSSSFEERGIIHNYGLD